MADLITARELALWALQDAGREAEVAADPWAQEVMEKVSDLIRFIGGHDGTKVGTDGVTIPAWEIGAAPFDARMIAIKVAKRTYGNPDQEVSSTVGPIGSRVLDVAALLTELTEAERKTLAKYNPDGDPDIGGDGLWVLRGVTDGESLVEPVLFVPDDQQVNLFSTNAAPSWDFPLFEHGDPGDPNLYPEGT